MSNRRNFLIFWVLTSWASAEPTSESVPARPDAMSTSAPDAGNGESGGEPGASRGTSSASEDHVEAELLNIGATVEGKVTKGVYKFYRVEHKDTR